MLKKELLEYLNENTLIEIKGGLEREKFIEIWMVNVDERIFARSWNKGKKSWFTEFQKSGVGQIKFGEKILNVFGEKIQKDDEINEKIDEAYLRKYIQPENLKYAKGIAQPEYADYTMEFKINNWNYCS